MTCGVSRKEHFGNAQLLGIVEIPFANIVEMSAFYFYHNNFIKLGRTQT